MPKLPGPSEVPKLVEEEIDKVLARPDLAIQTPSTQALIVCDRVSGSRNRLSYNWHPIPTPDQVAGFANKLATTAVERISKRLDLYEPDQLEVERAVQKEWLELYLEDHGPKMPPKGESGELDAESESELEPADTPQPAQPEPEQARAFAKNLRHHRIEKGWSQDELAKRLADKKTSVESWKRKIVKYEQSETPNPYPSTKKKLADALGVTPTDN